VKLRKETTREMIKSVRTVSTGHLYVNEGLIEYPIRINKKFIN
jgi:hypothetical protein